LHTADDREVAVASRVAVALAESKIVEDVRYIQRLRIDVEALELGRQPRPVVAALAVLDDVVVTDGVCEVPRGPGNGCIDDGDAVDVCARETAPV